MNTKFKIALFAEGITIKKNIHESNRIHCSSVAAFYKYRQ